MLANISNYRPGGKYLLTCEGKEVGFEVISHGYKSLELKRLDNGFVKSYSTSELSPVSKSSQAKFKKSLKPKPEKPVDVKPVVEVKPAEVAIEKPAAKVVEVKPESKAQPKKDEPKVIVPSIDEIRKMVSEEEVEDWKFIVKCIKWELRIDLKKKGWETKPNWSISEVLKLIKESIKENPTKK